jgi:predicted ribosomally synthesized peptide with nif11-like leader
LLAIPLPMNRPSEALLAFTKFLEKDEDLQSKIKAAENPQQIIDIAESEGFTISPLELRTWSKELTANSFPWATKGNDFRRNFFKRAGQ